MFSHSKCISVKDGSWSDRPPLKFKNAHNSTAKMPEVTTIDNILDKLVVQLKCLAFLFFFLFCMIITLRHHHKEGIQHRMQTEMSIWWFKRLAYPKSVRWQWQGIVWVLAGSFSPPPFASQRPQSALPYQSWPCFSRQISHAQSSTRMRERNCL